MAGSVTSVTQVGYGVGLFLLVSLADLIEHRRLVLIQSLCTAACLLSVALVAPVGGRLADAGWTRACTIGAMAVLGLSFLASRWLGAAGALAGFAGVAVLVDAAVQMNHVVSQRVIYMTPAATRGRVNAMYMTVTFVGGAAGSMLGALTYHRGGWSATALTGAASGLALLLFQATEPVRVT
jgi:predicted MFS family arabinose efflux permease